MYLSKNQCKVIYEVVDTLSEGNYFSVFSHDSVNDLRDPFISAFYEICFGADVTIPSHIKFSNECGDCNT